METFSSFLFYYSIAIATAIIVYIVGHLSLLFVKQDHENTAKSLSLKLFTGIIVLVSIFAIIKTHGNTIYSGLLLMLLFILYYYKKNNKLSFSYTQENIRFFEVKEFLYFLLLTVAFICLFLFLFGYKHANLSFYYDYFSYSAVSNSLLINGIESTNIFINMPGSSIKSVPVFYHYFELWFSALVKVIFNIRAIYALVFVVQPVFFSLILLLVKCFVIQNINLKHKFIIHLIPFLIIFISSNAEILNIFLPHIHYKLVPSHLLSFMHLKLSIVYICVLWLIQSWKHSLFEQYISLGILCFLYPPTLPVVVAGSLCFMVYLLVFNKHSFSWISLMYILTPGIYIAIFYLCQQNDRSVTNSISIVFIELDKIRHYSFCDIKKIIADTFYFYAAFLLYIIPLYALTKYYFHVNRQKLSKFLSQPLLLVSFLFITSMIIHSLMFGIVDAYQIQKNLFFPIFNIISFFTLILLLKNHKFLFLLFVFINFISFFLFLNKTYNTENITLNSSKYIYFKNEFSNKIFSSIYIKNQTSYISIFDKGIDFIVPYPYICRFTDSYYPVCLSVFEIPKSKNNIESYYADNIIFSSPFYRFVGNTTSKPIDSLKKEFIKKYHIDYLFIEKGNTFLETLKSMPVEKRISFNDEPFEIIKFKW